jgi:penicillin amidase
MKHESVMFQFDPGRTLTDAACRGKACLALALAAIIATGCASGSYIAYKISPDYPKDKPGEGELPGLKNPVTVFIDSAGVPHIEALDEEDLLRAVGYMQGRARFFEMDILRRFARGRLSELVGDQPILGSSTVEFDLAMRGWGFDRQSEEDAAALDAEMKRLMEAYTDGVNRALVRYRPIEYRLLRVEPEPWKAGDIFAVGRLTAWSVTHNWQQEAVRLLLALYGGIDRSEKIYPNDWWRGPVSIKSEAPKREMPPAIAPELRTMFPPRPPVRSAPPPQGIGMRTAAAATASIEAASNSWVISGALSASGKPMTANDPHMTHMLPSILFQQHMKCPGLDAIGATVPGLPYPVFGHNASVSWGVTSAVGDVVDLYIEKSSASSPDEYETPAGPKKFEKSEETIKVRDGDRFYKRTFRIRRTVHGPALNDMYPGLFPDWAPVVALRWDTTGAAGSMTAMSRALRAADVRSFRKEMLSVVTPVSAFTAADSSGNIAIFATGSLPLRKGHLGTFPVPGWLPAYEWSGMVKPEDMPVAVSADGFFAHGNNLMEEPDRGRVFINADSAPSYRLERISELIQAKKNHDWRSMAEIQKDVFLFRGKRIAPAMISDLGSFNDLTMTEKAALDVLKAWDFHAAPESPGPVVFFLTYREAIIEAMGDELDRNGIEFMLSQRYSTNVADQWFEDTDHVVWDDRLSFATEKRRDAVRAAFRRAVAQASTAQGPDPNKWRWGALHDMHFKHLFGSKRAIAGFFNLPQSEAGGALDSVWKSHFDLGHPETPFRAMAGPAYRQVVDMADTAHGHWIIDTGSSGWAGSPNYGDQHLLWKRGELIPMLYDWKEIAAGAKAVMTLR